MPLMCSSLSVFALHPLYLRVQALSDAIPADVKVYLCYAFIFIHCMSWLCYFYFTKCLNELFLTSFGTQFKIYCRKKFSRRRSNWIKRLLHLHIVVDSCSYLTKSLIFGYLPNLKMICKLGRRLRGSIVHKIVDC